MNDYIDIVLAVVMIAEAISFFTNKATMRPKMVLKYTPESLTKFNYLSGVATLLTAIGFMISGLSKLGIINIGVNFEERDASFWIFYGSVLAVLIIIEIIGHYAILKKKTDAEISEAKTEEKEDEDF